MTVLTLMNGALKRVGVIQGDAGALATDTTSTATGLVATEALLSDTARQHQVDVMLQVINEAVQGVFAFGLLAKEAATGSITLSTNTREYALATDFERMAGQQYGNRVLRGATDYQLLHDYPGGYAQMLADQPTASDWQGQPEYYALSPVGDNLRIDRDPTSTVNGRIYYYLYDKRVGFTTTMATTALPFSDTVQDNLIPVCAEMWTRAFKKDADPVNLQLSLTRALEYAGRVQHRDRWAPTRQRS